MSDDSTLCLDCRIDTLPTDKDRAEWYTVHGNVWLKSGLAPGGGCLCIGCLESRLGRRLTPGDFTSAPVNDLSFTDMMRFAWSWRTERLTERLSGGEKNGL